MKKTILSLTTLTTAVLLTLGAGCGTTTQTQTQTQKPTNTTATNTNTNTATVTTFNEEATNAEITAEKNGQWATSATASTQYGTDSWSAKQATAEPNVETYGDNSRAWAPAEKNKGTQTLELTYTKAAVPTGIRIHENLGSGAVSKVEVKNIDGEYKTVWQGTDKTEGLAYLQLPVTGVTDKVNGVKITVDTTKAPTDWVEIDAVQLVGE
ncbi:MAG: hypothetical protein WCW27_01020 [Patescibacteria group bacterium]|jgi:hypothetical protein